ncbi:hypothetical protein FRC09_006831 [Ceratobasidium sp. 395]|nr:hypothetical protein FRC09_006831 [Ceratobasidium sp. 395]
MPYNVTIDNISPLITYQGQWIDAFDFTSDPYYDRYLGVTFHSSETNGAQAFFQFNGTAIYIFGAKRGNHGNYAVQVDDEQPRQFNGFAPIQPDGTDGVYQVPIYARTDLSNGLHKVVFTNQGDLAHPFVDIDFITWTSNDEASTNKTLDDGQFEYTPADAWDNSSPFVGDYFGRTEHLTTRGGASASLTFEGTGIYLYGGILSDHGAFTIELNDHPPVVMNGSSSGYHPRVPLYYADGLGLGKHKLTITNTDTQGKFLDIDYVDIVQPPASTSSPLPASTLTPTQNPSAKGGNTPIIVGVVCGVLAVLALAAVSIWYLMRRRKSRSESVDLINDEPKPYTAGPPDGYGPSGGGPGWNGVNTLQRSKPWPNMTQSSAYTHPKTNDLSTYHGATRLISPYEQYTNYSEASASDAHVHVTVLPSYPKGRAPVIQNAEGRGARSDDELRETRMRVPDRPQDWGTLSETSENETVEVLPPDYRQATEPFAPPRQVS